MKSRLTLFHVCLLLVGPVGLGHNVNASVAGHQQLHRLGKLHPIPVGAQSVQTANCRRLQSLLLVLGSAHYRVTFANPHPHPHAWECWETFPASQMERCSCTVAERDIEASHWDPRACPLSPSQQEVRVLCAPCLVKSLTEHTRKRNSFDGPSLDTASFLHGQLSHQRVVTSLLWC